MGRQERDEFRRALVGFGECRVVDEDYQARKQRVADAAKKVHAWENVWLRFTTRVEGDG